ncbi:MAG TPA: hypothetical protein VN894_01755 [Polyangiaceae bacterium]|nr:hypothetical protein [Polyangiaceae bacterium]
MSESNQREHWAKKHRRISEQRHLVMLILGLSRHFPLPLQCRLTRLAPRELDTDNLAISFKGVRDQIAAWLGVDDRDPRVSWSYSQEKNRNYSLRLEIFRLPLP